MHMQQHHHQCKKKMLQSIENLLVMFLPKIGVFPCRLGYHDVWKHWKLLYDLYETVFSQSTPSLAQWTCWKGPCFWQIKMRDRLANVFFCLWKKYVFSIVITRFCVLIWYWIHARVSYARKLCWPMLMERKAILHFNFLPGKICKSHSKYSNREPINPQHFCCMTIPRRRANMAFRLRARTPKTVTRVGRIENFTAACTCWPHRGPKRPGSHRFHPNTASNPNRKHKLHETSKLSKRLEVETLDRRWSETTRKMAGNCSCLEKNR